MWHMWHGVHGLCAVECSSVQFPSVFSIFLSNTSQGNKARDGTDKDKRSTGKGTSVRTLPTDFMS